MKNLKSKKLLLILMWMMMVFWHGGCRKSPHASELIINDDELQRVVPEILVQAAVVSVTEPRDGWLESLLKIDRVYIGPAEIYEQTFIIGSSKSGQGNLGMGIYPPLQEGEVGIWSLYENNGDLLVYPWSLAELELELPARSGISEKYEQTKAVAEAIKQLLDTDDAARLPLLKKEIFSEIPEVSKWAINIVGQLNDDNIREYLRSLQADERLSSISKTAIKKVLSVNDSDHADN